MQLRIRDSDPGLRKISQAQVAVRRTPGSAVWVTVREDLLTPAHECLVFWRKVDGWYVRDGCKGRVLVNNWKNKPTKVVSPLTFTKNMLHHLRGYITEVGILPDHRLVNTNVYRQAQWLYLYRNMINKKLKGRQTRRSSIKWDWEDYNDNQEDAIRLLRPFALKWRASAKPKRN